MSHMLRTLFWLLVWLLTLGIANIKVEYADGLTINLRGWLGGKDE